MKQETGKGEKGSARTSLQTLSFPKKSSRKSAEGADTRRGGCKLRPNWNEEKKIMMRRTVSALSTIPEVHEGLRVGKTKDYARRWEATITGSTVHP